MKQLMRQHGWKVALVVGSIVSSIVCIVLWLFLTTEGTAQVYDTTWRHVVQLKQRETRHGEDWRWSMPHGAFNVSCVQRQSGTSSCWHDSEMQCPDYDDWCEYSYYAWPVILEKVDSGDTHAVRWPKVRQPGYLQRVDRTAEYKIKFKMRAKGQKVLTHKERSLSEFKKFTRGHYWRVKTNRAGMIWPLKRQMAEGT